MNYLQEMIQTTTEHERCQPGLHISINKIHTHTYFVSGLNTLRNVTFRNEVYRLKRKKQLRLKRWTKIYTETENVPFCLTHFDPVGTVWLLLSLNTTRVVFYENITGLQRLSLHFAPSSHCVTADQRLKHVNKNKKQQEENFLLH